MKPFLKWVGGKQKLVPQLVPLMRPYTGRYIEPFMGGAAMFFHLKPERALLCDANPNLVNTFQEVRWNHEGIITLLRRHQENHTKDPEYYYEVRSYYNQPVFYPALEKAAAFIYLNKTCFNGLHRVNKKGHFNVPKGDYKNPMILDADMIWAASTVLKSVDVRCQGFQSLEVQPGDFVYIDPPYAPLSTTSNFTGYAGEFGVKQQTELRDKILEWSAKGATCMLSNSTAPIMYDLYKDFDIQTIDAARAINSKGSGRGKIQELVIRPKENVCTV